MDNWTAPDIQFAKETYYRIVKEHALCNGTGFLTNDLCACKKAYKYIVRLIEARIPRRFWGVRLTPAAMEILQNDKVPVLGTGIGSGCTSFLSAMAYTLCERKEDVMYMKASEYWSTDVFSDDDLNLLRNRMTSTEYLLIDDFDDVAESRQSDAIRKIVKDRYDKSKFVCVVATKKGISQFEFLLKKGTLFACDKSYFIGERIWHKSVDQLRKIHE